MYYCLEERYRSYHNNGIHEVCGTKGSRLTFHSRDVQNVLYSITYNTHLPADQPIHIANDGRIMERCNRD